MACSSLEDFAVARERLVEVLCEGLQLVNLDVACRAFAAAQDALAAPTEAALLPWTGQTSQTCSASTFSRPPVVTSCSSSVISAGSTSSVSSASSSSSIGSSSSSFSVSPSSSGPPDACRPLCSPSGQSSSSVHHRTSPPAVCSSQPAKPAACRTFRLR